VEKEERELSDPKLLPQLTNVELLGLESKKEEALFKTFVLDTYRVH